MSKLRLETLDRVIVKPKIRKTNLGVGVIKDIICDKYGFPEIALVIFEHGPAKGVWYNVRSLEVRA